MQEVPTSLVLSQPLLTGSMTGYRIQTNRALTEHRVKAAESRTT